MPSLKLQELLRRVLARGGFALAAKHRPRDQAAGLLTIDGVSPAAKALWIAGAATRDPRGEVVVAVVPADRDVEQMAADVRFFLGGLEAASADELDHAVFPCANCFFGTSDHYYCFATDNKVLIGHRRAPVMNWRDSSKNALPKLHGGWADWNVPGQNVALRYDDQYIWLPRPAEEPKRGVWASMKAATAWVFRAKSKQVRLTRSTPRDIFAGNERCRGADRAKAPGF